MSFELLIVLAYLALTLVIGFVSSRRTKNDGAFQGKQMGMAAIVFAAAGEWLGGTATSGVSEYGFTYGLSGAWYTIANGLGVLFLAVFFCKLYRSLNMNTIPGIISKFFGKQARKVSCLLLVLVMLVVGLSQIIAAGKLGQALLGLDFQVTATIFAAVFIVFTILGGMCSVAAANCMHLFVMYGGVILALVICVIRAGGFGAFFTEARAIDSGLLNATSIGGTKISSWIIASLLGACTAQAGIQPVLAAKDIKTARHACFCTALVVAPFGLITATLGIAARIMSEQGTLLSSSGELVTEAKLALPTLMLNLPPLAGGLVLASILAAIMSTVSPIILSSGTMLAKDLYEPKHPEASPKKLLTVSRLMTAISGVICWIGAIALVKQTMVLDVVYAAYSLRGAIFVVLLIGILQKQRSGKAACISMVLTGVMAVAWTVIEVVTGVYPIAPWFTETYAAVCTAAVSMLLFSGLLPKDNEEVI